MPSFLRESTFDREGPLLISKPLKLPVLLSSDEMEAFLAELRSAFPTVLLFQAHGLCKRGEEIISFEQFLHAYCGYIADLKAGLSPPLSQYSIPFSCFFTCSTDILYGISVGEEKWIVKSTRPVIQMQMNQLHYSKESGAFHSMSYGQENISWGLQFSYPQLFQDPKTQMIEQVKMQEMFPNTSLFKFFQLWVREHTTPTPFIIDGKKKMESVRIGKNCFSWIDCHPDLVRLGFSCKLNRN